MSTAGGEIAAMADFVAQAIFKAADPEGDWLDLTEEERNDFRLVAHAAMGAHDAWLTSQGYVIGKRKAKPKLIVPEKPKLVGLH